MNTDRLSAAERMQQVDMVETARDAVVARSNELITALAKVSLLVEMGLLHGQVLHTVTRATASAEIHRDEIVKFANWSVSRILGGGEA